VRRASLGALTVALAGLAGPGCGGIIAPDLFIVDRTGPVPGRHLTLLVNEEGVVHCNGVKAPKLSDSELVQARSIQEALHDPASRHLSLAPAAGSVIAYRVRDEAGTVAFSDNSAGQPAVLRRLALFVLRTARQICHLPQ
jgi:hypothetical protein